MLTIFVLVPSEILATTRLHHRRWVLFDVNKFRLSGKILNAEVIRA